MELDYNSISNELQQLKDLQTKVTQRLDSLQAYLSSVAKINGLNYGANDNADQDEHINDQFYRKLDVEQELIDKIWENKVYDAVCSDVGKPLTEDELKNYGFGVSAEDYAKYIDDMTKMQEANQP